MNRQTLTLAMALSCGVSLYLIGTESPPPRIVSSGIDGADAQPATDALLEKSAEEDTLSDEQETPESASNSAEPTESALDIAFQAPFPNRVNLFHAPKRQGKGSTNSVGQTESAVELLGFVNVGSQRAVLSIDGMVSPLEEGGKQYGIEVISIQPPTVVLQRGRQRWQATLAN